jgi:uncharacterized membrane protein YphA (DoxX/SURF4 family)
VIATLDRVHRAVVRLPALAVLTVATRLLLAVGFIPPGLAKVLGNRFTLLPPEGSAVGLFFEGFFQSGAYYGFVGLMQVAAGVMLLVPGTALLGALLYLPIVVNIFVITVALQFRGTWLIAGAMLFANLYLLAWDYDRLRTIVFREPPPLTPDHRPQRRGFVAWL